MALAHVIFKTLFSIYILLIYFVAFIYTLIYLLLFYLFTCSSCAKKIKDIINNDLEHFPKLCQSCAAQVPIKRAGNRHRENCIAYQ